MNGYGQFRWPGGKNYKGMYEKDLKHGRGKMVYGDGTVYDGDWFQGKQNGKGAFTDKMGRKLQNNWQNGVAVTSI